MLSDPKVMVFPLEEPYSSNSREPENDKINSEQKLMRPDERAIEMNDIRLDS